MRLTANLSRRSYQGFTLIEAIVCVAVVSTLIATAIPAFSSTLTQNALSLSTLEFNAALSVARSTAISTGTRAVVAATNAENWNNGWIVFQDTNDNGAREQDEPVLYGPVTINPQIKVTSHFGSGVDATALSVDSTGMVRKPGSHGLVLGRIVMEMQGSTRALCFSAVRVRTLKGNSCKD